MKEIYIRYLRIQKRHFLYARYNANLSPEGLEGLGLGHINSTHVREMDSVKYINELREVGESCCAGSFFRTFLVLLYND